MTKSARKKRERAPAATRPDTGPTAEALQHSEITYVPTSRFNEAPVARRVGMHDRLVETGRITGPQWEWADRYVRECEVVAGGREGPSDRERVDGDTSEPIYDRATAANAFLRRSNDRMSPAQRRLIWDSCVMAFRIGDVAVSNLGLKPSPRTEDRPGETMTAFGDRVRERVQREVVKAITIGCGIVEGVMA
jgi:hypothetical protein